jgi:outer membrane protein assembly factor BamB
VDGDRIYVHFGHQGIACLNTQGEIVWKNNEVKYAPVHGNGGSPALVDGLLIYSCDGAKDPFVVALDAQTGKVQWKFQRPGDPPKKFSFCTPLVIEVAGKQQVIIPGSGIVNALDPQTGAEIWSVKHGGYSVIPRPVYGHGLVYFSTSYDSPVVLAVRPDGHGDVTETHVAWEAKKGAPHTPSLLLVGDELYMLADKGILTCLDAKTGDQHWQERIGGNYSSSPIYADGKIYIQSEAGQGMVFRAGKTFEKLAENGFGERSLASYAIGDGAIFIRTAENLYRVEKPR